MKVIVLLIIAVVLLSIALGTWSCLVVGARAEKEYREKKKSIL